MSCPETSPVRCHHRNFVGANPILLRIFMLSDNPKKDGIDMQFFKIRLNYVGCQLFILLSLIHLSTFLKIRTSRYIYTIVLEL